jgi:hypothetical protein
VRTALREACQAAEAALANAAAPAALWRDAAATLDLRVGEAIDGLVDGPEPLRAALADIVLAHARDSLLLSRAWFAPLGFEARPDAVPPLARLLEGAPEA